MKYAAVMRQRPANAQLERASYKLMGYTSIIDRLPVKARGKAGKLAYEKACDIERVQLIVNSSEEFNDEEETASDKQLHWRNQINNWSNVYGLEKRRKGNIIQPPKSD